MRLRSVEDLLRDERKLLQELELYRAAIEAAYELRYQSSNYIRNDMGELDTILDNALKDYDTARSTLPDRDGPEQGGGKPAGKAP